MVTMKEVAPWLYLTPGGAKAGKVAGHGIQATQGVVPLFAGMRSITAQFPIGPCLSSEQDTFSQSNIGSTQLGVNSYRDNMVRINDDFSLVQDVLILLSLDKFVDEDTITLLTTRPYFMKFLHENRIDHTPLDKFKCAIAITINSLFQKLVIGERSCVSLRDILIGMSKELVSTEVAKEISWTIVMVTHQNTRNQRLFANDAIRDMFVYLFQSVPNYDHYSTLPKKNIVWAMSNITRTLDGKKVFNTKEVAAILDLAKPHIKEKPVSKNVHQIRKNLSLLSD